MKVLPFNIPIAHDRTVIVQEELLPHFYPHMHAHEEIQITLIQRGEGSLMVGHQEHYFNSNEVFVIGANVPHVFKSSPAYHEDKQGLQLLTIFFNPRGKLSSLFNLPEFKSVGSFFNNNYSGFRIPPQNFADISGRILCVKYTSQMEQLLQFFELLKALHSLTNLIPLSSERPASVAPPVNYDTVRMNSIYSFITANYHKALTLDSIADYANMTPQAFCRYFKKHTRLTFIAFVNEVRINEACKKLVSGKFDSVAAVALDCGYSNITNFNRVFKSVTKQSPSSYIRSLNN